MVLNIKFLLTSLIVLSLMVVIQCGSPTKPLGEKTILGDWRWENSTGGIAGTTRTPETEGYQFKITFNNDSTFIRTVKDSSGLSYYEGTYYVAYEDTPLWDYRDSSYIIYMDNAEPAILEMTINKLLLIEMCADCFGHSYLRVTE